jgi:hypothetical protein
MSDTDISAAAEACMAGDVMKAQALSTPIPDDP